MDISQKVAFVLCRPMHSGNIGSAARALKNMGFSDLRLIAPAASADSRAARSMAVHAGDVLRSATVHPDLDSALADRAVAVGTTCRQGLYRSGAEDVRASVRAIAELASSNPVAIVFGPENHGLTNDELKRCHRLMTIPTAPDYPSLNLAQAVMVVAYELMLAGGTAREVAPMPEFAQAGEVEGMLSRMEEALVEIGFLPADNPDHIMFALRAIFGRSGLTRRELDILNGIARQMKWTAQGGALTLQSKRAAGRKLR
jgi:tRNA/rRNA methyltransferase